MHYPMKAKACIVLCEYCCFVTAHDMAKELGQAIMDLRKQHPLVMCFRHVAVGVIVIHRYSQQ